MPQPLLGAAIAAALSLAAAPVLASVTFVDVDKDVAIGAYTYDFGVGGALTFNSDTSSFGSVYGVQTTGTTQVFSAFGTPSLFQTFATTLFPSQQLGSFASYATSTAVPYSLAAGTLGFKYTLADGDHFGIAKTEGSFIDALYLETTPGADIDLSISPPTGTGVPEPGTWALMIMGFGLAGAQLRRNRRPVALSV